MPRSWRPLGRKNNVFLFLFSWRKLQEAGLQSISPAFLSLWGRHTSHFIITQELPFRPVLTPEKLGLRKMLKIAYSRKTGRSPPFLPSFICSNETVKQPHFATCWRSQRCSVSRGNISWALRSGSPGVEALTSAWAIRLHLPQTRFSQYSKRSVFFGPRQSSHPANSCKKICWRSRHCGHTQHYWTVHLKTVKMVNFLLCDCFYHNNVPKVTQVVNERGGSKVPALTPDTVR